jgi:hypothetical protein
MVELYSRYCLAEIRAPAPDRTQDLGALRWPTDARCYKRTTYVQLIFNRVSALLEAVIVDALDKLRVAQPWK